MKIIIAGGRDFNNYELLEKELYKILPRKRDEPIEIVSGGATGADALGEKYAKEHFLRVKKFPANWDKWGKSAGPKRNTEMADYANILIAFYDGKSRGTANMILTAKIKNLKIHIINY